MARLRLFALVCGLGIFSVGNGVFSQDKDTKKEKTTKEDETTKTRGSLPASWSKLGLTDEQKQKTYKIRARYKDQLDEIATKVTKLKDEEKKELQTVLTEEQKKHLVEIKTGEKGKEEKK